MVIQSFPPGSRILAEFNVKNIKQLAVTPNVKRVWFTSGRLKNIIGSVKRDT